MSDGRAHQNEGELHRNIFDRLERIEYQIGDISETLKALVRVEERTTQHQEMLIKLFQKHDAFEERLRNCEQDLGQIKTAMRSYKEAQDYRFEGKISRKDVMYWVLAILTGAGGIALGGVFLNGIGVS